MVLFPLHCGLSIIVGNRKTLGLNHVCNAVFVRVENISGHRDTHGVLIPASQCITAPGVTVRSTAVWSLSACASTCVCLCAPYSLRCWL